MADRHRAFVAVFYPESAPDNWREIVESWHVPALVILHDQDEDEHGDPKKHHLHLLMYFEGKKSLAQIRSMVKELGSEVVQPSYDMRGSARYLLHLDQPEKHQYPFAALESFSGAPALELTAPVGDPSPDIIAWCREQGITEYSALINYCLDQRPDWYRWARSNSIFFAHYLRSVRGGRSSEGGNSLPR